jgi:hypothetical protein
MPGFYKATIVSHSIGSTQNDTPFISFKANLDNEEITFPIWISNKAMGMARACLKRCGFDVDKYDLKILRADPTFLAGKEVTLEYRIDEQYGDGFQVALSRVTDESLDSLTRAMRNAKKKGQADPDEDLPF